MKKLSIIIAALMITAGLSAKSHVSSMHAASGRAHPLPVMMHPHEHHFHHEVFGTMHKNYE